MTDGERRRRGAPKAAKGPSEDKSSFGSNGHPRSVTLTLPALPLTLPGEHRPANSSAKPPARATEAGHLDAWTLDRLRRSSLPPAMAKRAATAFPPPPRTPTPLPEVLDAAEDGGALSLVGRSPVPPAFTVDLFSEMSDRFALGDFTGALRAAELVLGQDPTHDLAQHYRNSSRSKLEGIYTSRLSVGGPVPELAIEESELRWLGLDPQVGLVLARVDGAADIEAVIADSGVPRLEALRALVELLESRVIRLV